MTSKHLKQTLHIHNNSIVEDIVSIFHLVCSIVLKFSFDMLLDLLATLILCQLILLQNCINGFLDSLLIALFSDTNYLSDHYVFQPVL